MNPSGNTHLCLVVQAVASWPVKLLGGTTGALEIQVIASPYLSSVLTSPAAASSSLELI